MAVDALLAGLTVDPASFWVNLHPAEPDRISDPRLGLASLARVLLLADLELKRESARITDPRTAAGRDYWNHKGGSNSAAAARVWIIPGSTVVRAWEGQVFLESASLEVQLDVHSESERIEREIVLPRLRAAVNQDARFADLRAAYAGLVPARALRTSGPDASARFPTAWEEAGWSPADVWREYARSYREGEYDVTERQSHSQGLVTTVRQTRYVAGGVDFTGIETSPHVVIIDEPPPLAALAAVAAALSPSSALSSGNLVGVIVPFETNMRASGGLPNEDTPGSLVVHIEPSVRRVLRPAVAIAILGAAALIIFRRRGRDRLEPASKPFALAVPRTLLYFRARRQSRLSMAARRGCLGSRTAVGHAHKTCVLASWSRGRQSQRWYLCRSPAADRPRHKSWCWRR